MQRATILASVTAAIQLAGASGPACRAADVPDNSAAASAESATAATPTAALGAGGGNAAPVPKGATTATFAGGCFWCMESPFDETAGVIDTVVGYTGGRTTNPTYKQVSYDETGHYEAIRVTYDPQKVSYEKLLEVFWHNIDPTDDGGQFCDRGHSYKTAIFAHDDEQRRAAELSRADIGETGGLASKVVTPIIDAPAWWNAEDYHQDYYQKNPIRYRYYRSGCGRDKRLKELWG